MDRKQAVLYIITKLELGGAQKVCLALLDHAKRAGIVAGLISGTDGVLVPQAQQYDHVYLLSELTREISLMGLVQELKGFYALIKTIRRFKQQYPQLIVHTHSTKAGLLGRWAALFAGVTIRVHTVHGFGFNRYQSSLRWFIMWFFEWITAWITTHYVCVAKTDLLQGASLLPLFKARCSVIRAAVALKPTFAKVKRNKDVFVIGTISCFKPQKNLMDLLKAFVYARQLLAGKTAPELMLEIIGDGQMRDELEASIDNNYLRDVVKLHGWQTEITPFLRCWDLFAMSSLWEGLPCAIVEARLCQLPVVAYAVDGVPEVIVDDVNGYLVMPGNWRLLGYHMAKLALNHALCLRLASHQDDLQAFTYEAMFMQHQQLYLHFQHKN